MWQLFTNFLPLIGLDFYLYFALPAVLTLIMLMLQAFLDKVWVSHDDVGNKFNHWFFLMVVFIAAYLGLRLAIFNVPFFADFGLWRLWLLGGIVFFQGFVLFLCDSAFDEHKILNGFLVWFIGAFGWALFWYFTTSACELKLI